MVPCVIFEDDHLLVVNKPAGWNTHAPSPQAGEGIYDWLRHREPRWSSLAILHRLDKETSGVMVFGKSSLANRSLTRQFTRHDILKHYQLLTDQPAARQSWEVRNRLVRSGSRYVGAPGVQAGDLAETLFRVAGREEGHTCITAAPRTGRTHQIRVHAALSGLPILGDTLYGGSPFHRLCLHAESITLNHPLSGESCTFRVEPDFKTDARQALRRALIEEDTNAFRLVHGASDGWPGWYVDRLGDFLLSQSEGGLETVQQAALERLAGAISARGTYHKTLRRQVRRTPSQQTCPQRV